MVLVPTTCAVATGFTLFVSATLTAPSVVCVSVSTLWCVCYAHTHTHTHTQGKGGLCLWLTEDLGPEAVHVSCLFLLLDLRRRHLRQPRSLGLEIHCHCCLLGQCRKEVSVRVAHIGMM